MADRYLLESGSPDGYLLEDGSGVLLLEAATVQWSVSDQNAGVTLSNANLTATITSVFASVRANVGGTGKFYFEVSADAIGSSFNIGVSSASTSFLDWVGDLSSDAASMKNDSSLFYSSGNPASGVSYTTADIIGIAVDQTNKLVWFAKNNTWLAGTDPAAGTGGKSVSAASGPLYPTFQGNFSTETATGRFTAASQTYAPPTGFTALDSSALTHATTGALTGPGSTIAGTAVYNAAHSTSGVLTGPGSTIAGTAAHIAIHTSTGALTGAGSTIVGSAARTAVHTTTGVLTGPGSTIVGTAVYNAKHATSGALTGPGSVVVGAAARTRAHATTGALTGPGSTVAGTAVYNAKHATSGALTGPGSMLAGSAARFRTFAASGVLVGSGSTIAGAALRGIISITHATSGALIGQPSIIDGTARRTRQHATSGILTGPPALIVGVVTRWRDHDSSGTLLGVTGAVFGRGFNGTPQLHDIPVDSDNLVNEPSPPSEGLGPVSEPSGQIVNHPPYPAA